MQICYNPKALFVVFSERHACYRDEIQHKHLGQTRDLCKQSLSHLRTPKLASFTTCKYFTSPANSPLTAALKCSVARLLLCWCKLCTDNCQSCLQGGDTSTATTSNPWGSKPQTRVTQFPGNAIQQHLLLPSLPQCCQHKHTTRINGHTAVLQLHLQQLGYSLDLYLWDGKWRGRPLAEPPTDFHALPYAHDWNIH